MSVMQEPTTITSNVSSVMIWLRHESYFQRTHLLTHIFKHTFCSAGPVTLFSEETQKLKSNITDCLRPNQGIFENYFDSSQMKPIYLSSALAQTWRKYGKGVETEDSLPMELDRIQSFCGHRTEGVSGFFQRWTMWLCSSPVKSIINSILIL